MGLLSSLEEIWKSKGTPFWTEVFMGMQESSCVPFATSCDMDISEKTTHISQCKVLCVPEST